ncbi:MULTISPECIES: sensor histidine kinase [Psychrobacillus]|uniref:histidine kinase n=1 Tax=Psychrobacillus faecigallinarum TaxID=2762235 RepID=A0ABR8R830_9BACI|nr:MULTISPECIES: HAMP domain-containing sensor histidine kinase [Psychrobacillus]MBD7943954.1 HAMP domain-containing histidine kinase [Psychrobacillus faecigallinarum]QEY19454.1 sensor histidine kinase [Psychrobacillus sp. AK 1817]QGM29949.1 two-component sensor histidine kinase [Bacillus sp. N3536]
MLQTFLINILFITLPVLLFVVFLDNKKRKEYIYFFILSSSISMILCMIYPIRLELGFTVDLRYIPFFTLALYGGYKKLFPLYIILNIVRFFVGGEGVIQSFIFSTVAFAIVPLMHKRFINYSPKKRIFTGILMVLINDLTYLISLTTFFDKLTTEYWTVAAYIIVTYVIVMLFNLSMVEKILSNIKQRDNFLRAERLHVMSELSASVSHEIRNPLTVTNGFLQLLSVSKDITPNDKVYIDYSLKELNRAENILNDFLAFAKPQSVHMVQSTLEEELVYVKNVMMPYAKFHEVEILLLFQNTVKIKFDQNQMKQCIINLLKNGVESMKGKGGLLLVRAEQQGKNLIITIEDEGIGMTSEEISQLGKPYYSNKKEGTGLGMLMVYGTISTLKGNVEVKSQKGKGTIFTITIPV